MADKTPTVIEPTAADVEAITLILKDGEVTSIEVSIEVKTNDASIRYKPSIGSSKTLPADYSQKIQEGLSLFASEVVAKFAAAEGFTIE